MIEELSISSFGEFHSKVYSPDTYGTLYRGQKDIGWPLIPKIGRYLDKFEELGQGKTSLLRAELEVMETFRKQAAYHLGHMPADGWPLWSIAQHHGLPTRLMDWTHIPLVALFFAVEEPFNGDSVVYALKIPEGHMSPVGESLSHPLDIKQGFFRELNETMVPDDVRTVARILDDRMLVRAYEPSHETARVHAQSAMFTIQEDPTLPLDNHLQPYSSASVSEAGNLTRIRIQEHARQPIRHALFAYGITRKSLFPELDGLADWLIYMKFISPFET